MKSIRDRGRFNQPESERKAQHHQTTQRNQHGRRTATSALARTLRVTGLDQVVPVFTSRAAALRGMQARSGFPPVGSSGQKRRKGNKKPQHLSKVGTVNDQQEERDAIASNMGFGGSSEGARKVVFIGLAVIFIFAILGLLALNTFH